MSGRLAARLGGIGQLIESAGGIHDDNIGIIRSGRDVRGWHYSWDLDGDGKMTQRKLTDDELQCVKQALIEMGQISGAWDVYSRIRDMVREGTTDGKPYVEPEPPIPDGYRLAVAGDEVRRDCKFLGTLGWMDRESCRRGMAFEAIYRYIVPADRTPTDEDAKSRPEVMVRDCDGQKWHKDILILVRGCEHSKFKFATTDTERAEIVCWKQCRHLYPGE